MADWTDGPEYAPLERPDGFVPPAIGPLESPISVAGPLPQAPESQPDYDLSRDAVPLDRLAAPAGQARNPFDSFGITTTPLTVAPEAFPNVPTAPIQLSMAASSAASLPQPSAWGAVHTSQAGPRQHGPWAPRQPLALHDRTPVQLPPPEVPYSAPHINPQPFAPPQTQPWDAPFGAPSQPPPAAPVTLRSVLLAATPGVLICLLLGGIIAPVAIWLMFVAHALAGRIRYRRMFLSKAFRFVEAATAILGALTLFISYGTLDLMLLLDAWSGWAQWGDGALIVVVLLSVYFALRDGDRPEATS